jgi:hypothetical protein
MLRSMDEVKGYVLAAKDGEIGRCKDFLFDDEQWTIRYMVADTRKWIPGRKVLISPISLEDPDWTSKRLPVHLTKLQIEKAPLLKDHEPVSRQDEVSLHRYYGHPYYWVGTGFWGFEATPGALRAAAEERVTVPPEPEGDPHLRSADEVTGYHFEATDGEIGHVEDFIIDDDAWTIRYLVVDTRNWLPGRKVLIAPLWAEGFDWVERKVFVDLTQEQIRNSPEYDPRSPVNRDYENTLYDFYGRPVYW